MFSNPVALTYKIIAVLKFMRDKVKLNNDCSNPYCLLPNPTKVYLTQPRIAIFWQGATNRKISMNAIAKHNVC